MKILGAIELWSARFHYGQAPVFNASTYLDFLHRLAPHYRRRGAILIQDNASYHKDSEVWSWFKSNRHWLEVHQLPPYSPELNPTERLWQYTRKNGTHDRYFASPGEFPNPHVRMAAATLTRFSVRHEAGALWVAGIICTQERLATRKGDWVGEGRGAGTAGRRPRKKPAGRPRRTCAS